MLNLQLVYKLKQNRKLIKLGTEGGAKVGIEISSNKNKFFLEYMLLKNDEDITKKFRVDDKAVKNLKKTKLL